MPNLKLRCDAISSEVIARLPLNGSAMVEREVFFLAQSQQLFSFAPEIRIAFA